ncbi:hypothetical protein H4W79_000397 [Nocardiopsis terrae]|uniref:Transposase IS4-like domain-containing protein n=1 Tax=Nocardiopsis terrae TaxID=372655 RepID=A0ABR9HAY1_9ACTN|nr:hypothetical protein [Nocardiopsis terrae]
MADTSDNAAFFGYGGNDRSRSAFPKARLVTLSECASRAVVGVGVGAHHDGERDLTRLTLGALEPDMLLLADAGFYSWDLLGEVTQVGAHAAWRVGGSLELPVIAPLADGSYTALVFVSRTGRVWRERLIAQARAGEGVDAERARLVRVAEYTVPDRKAQGELICVLTTVMDPLLVPAVEIVWAYKRRWEHETAFAEIKTHLRGGGVVLRSKSARMTVAEIYGLLLAHYAMRALMCAAADETEVAADRLSFLGAVRVVRRHALGGAAFPPEQRAWVYGVVLEQVAQRCLPARRHRSCPRVIKRVRHSSFPIKRAHHVSVLHTGPPTPLISPAA